MKYIDVLKPNFLALALIISEIGANARKEISKNIYEKFAIIIFLFYHLLNNLMIYQLAFYYSCSTKVSTLEEEILT